MTAVKSETLILIDADVIIHLFKANRVKLLEELYKGRIYVLDLVREELRINAAQRKEIFDSGILQVMPFPTANEEMLREYTALRGASKGKGESACMAVCRYDKTILASSNLKDIGPYCRMHSIKYLTTMDILAIAYKKGFIHVDEADLAIYDIKSKGSRLTMYDEIEKYIASAFELSKLDY